MPSRQVRRNLQEKKLKLIERDDSSSLSQAVKSSLESDSASDNPTYQNPYDLDDADDGGDEDVTSSDQDGDEHVVYEDTIVSNAGATDGSTEKKAGSRNGVQKTDDDDELLAFLSKIDHDATVGDTLCSDASEHSVHPSMIDNEAAAIWEFAAIQLDPEVEMRRITQSRERQSTRRRLTTPHATLFGWMCPMNPLLIHLEEHKSGKRFRTFDPTAERYYTMKLIQGEQDGRKERYFDWKPTARYTRSFSMIAEIVSSGDHSGLQEFLIANPYHPGANLALAETHIQRDEFEAAHSRILNALGSFLYGMAPAFNIRTHRCHLAALDPRDAANALAALSNDLIVDWNGDSNPTEPYEKIKSAALDSPVLGNILFIRTLHYYAWSLLERGCPSSAAHIFRSILTLTVGRDHSHSLLHMANALARAHLRDVLEIFNGHWMPECISRGDTTSEYVTLLMAPYEVPKRTEGISTVSLNLEFLFPQFSFGPAVSGLRGPRDREYRSILNAITAEDFWRSFMDQKIGRRWCTATKSMQSDEQEDVSSFPDEYQMLLSLWMYPEFFGYLHRLLPSTIDKSIKQRLNELALKNIEHETEMLVNWVTRVTADAEPASVAKFVEVYEDTRKSLIESYVQQTHEIWISYIQYVLDLGHCLERLKSSAAIIKTDYCVPCGDLKAWLKLGAYMVCPEIYLQYRGTRPSEFNSRRPVLADVLLNSVPEYVDSVRAMRMRLVGSYEGTPLEIWWKSFRARTGSIHPQTSIALAYLHSLLPWSSLDVNGVNSRPHRLF